LLRQICFVAFVSFARPVSVFTAPFQLKRPQPGSFTTILPAFAEFVMRRHGFFINKPRVEGISGTPSALNMSYIFNSLAAFVGKRFFPRDDVWELKQKMDSLMWGMAIGLGVIAGVCLYGYLVAHVFMKTGGQL
jgi:hypothetical protein